MEKFVEQQRKRIELLEKMLADSNDGRSRSFHSKSAASLDLSTLEDS